jgi:hypothetical protein
MPTVLQFRRGTTSQNNSFTGAIGEITYDTQTDALRVHDGSTAGGFSAVSEAATQTLTNKTLTSPVINTATFGTSILPTSADGTTLGSASKEFSDLFLADGAVISIGNDQDVTITHDPDDGLFFKSAATADNNPFVLTLQTGETDIAANDVLGSINFQAPNEGTGTDAVLVSAGIDAVSEGDFSSSANATKLSFKTAASEAAAEKMSLSSAGLLTTSGGITSGAVVTSGAGLVIADAGTIGSASDTDAIAIGSDGDVTLTQDLELQHDGATVSFGANDDVSLTHVHDTGLLLNAAMVVQFRDSAINIGSPADGDLDINADDEIELNSTLIDINGNVEISGTCTTTGVHTFTAVPVFPNNTIETADLQADCVTGAKIADDTINSEHYAADSIDEEHIANDAVGSAELKTLSTLLIKNSSGSTLKTVHGAGA